MTGVRCCDDHGYFASETCPDCGDAGRVVVGSDRRARLSKFVSGALRHFPGDAGLELDDAGWTAFEDLVATVESTYEWADRETLAAVVATDPKGRFERDVGDENDRGESDRDEIGDSNGDRVRAAYGHSVDVALEPTDAPVPDRLYHGTAPRNVDAIRSDGLRPMGRQRVHLSESVEGARVVGRRHADDPVVLVVDAAAMQADGHRIVKRGTVTYTTERVPPAYLNVRASPE